MLILKKHVEIVLKLKAESDNGKDIPCSPHKRSNTVEIDQQKADFEKT
jgi:hypothetical protein